MRIPNQISLCQFQIEKFKINLANFGVESLVKYFILELFPFDSWLEFVVEPKIPYASSERYFLVQCQLFDRFLLKYNGAKIPSSLVILYFEFLMLGTGFFQLILIFDVISFSKEPSQKHFCESSLIPKFPLCPKSSLCSSPFNGSFQSCKSFFEIYVGFELVDVRQNGI